QKSIRPQDIGYFLPDNDAKEEVEFLDGKTVYHNVFNFTARVKAKVTQVESGPWSSTSIAQKLDQCLKGKAELWYTTEISETTRAGLRCGHHLWCEELEARFRMAPGEALRKLHALRYRVEEVRARKDPEAFVQKVITYGMSSGTATTVYSQLLLAHQILDGRLRLNVPEPTPSTSITTFIHTLTSLKATWFDIWQPQETSHPSSRPPIFRQPATSQRHQSSNRHNYSYQKYNSDQSNNEKQVGFSREARDYGHPQPRGAQQSQREQRKSFGQHNDRYRSNRARTENRKFETYNTEPSGQKSESEDDNQNLVVEDRDPYHDSYFQGLEDAHSDEDKLSDSEAANLCETVENYPANTVHIRRPQLEGKTNKRPKPIGLDEVALKRHVCQICKQKYPSNNKLHAHLIDSHYRKPCPSNQIEPPSSNSAIISTPDKPSEETILSETTSLPTIVTSTAARSNAPPGHAFQGRRYAQLLISIASPHNEQANVCLDTGCAMSLIDRTFLRCQHPTAKIQQMEKPVKVRGLGSSLHDASTFTEIDFYVRGKDNVIAHFKREIHIVEKLTANALIGMDIAVPEGWIIDLDVQQLIMPKCHGLSVQIHTQYHSQAKRIPVVAKTKTIIKPQSRAMVPISTTKGESLDIPSRDMIYEPLAMDALTTFPCLVSSNSSAILVQNDSNAAVTIGKCTPLGYITENDLDSGMVEIDELEAYHLVAQPAKSDSKSRLLVKGLLATAAYTSAISPSQATAEPQQRNEKICPNGVTIFGSRAEKHRLLNIVNEFEVLWKDRNCFAKTPTGEEMTIDLVPDWQLKYKAGQAKVYAAGTEDRRLIDKTFDSLHDQGRLRWTQASTPFSFPCFVIWKHVTKPDGSNERKGRVVIDIRALNQITLPDAYPIPTQADIIAAVTGRSFISTVDCASFFYQWKVKPEHQNRFTVSSHRGQETFNCAVMGFRNSPAYVQRIIDTILRNERDFARSYIDDIVIFSKTFDDHMNHLKAVFQKLKAHRIHLSPKKCFLSYPSVALLGQKVDALGLSSATDKLEAIRNLRFPRTLKQLEYYLGLTSWLRQYIHNYAQISAPLQSRKVRLNAELKAMNTTGTNRKRKVAKTAILDVTPDELNSFQGLQKAFQNPAMLVHFNPEQRLYADLDASGKGMGAMVYHSTKDPPSIKSVKPILFLSRLLKAEEKNYWPTELEVACCCWVISKIRHLMETSRFPTVIYTDHSSTVQIATQTSMTTTTSLVRLNLRHQRSSQYLSTFRLDVRHKPGKHNIVPDALSRLEVSSDRKETPESDNPETGNLISRNYNNHDQQTMAFPISIVQISPQFLTKLKEETLKDTRCKKLYDLIKNNDGLSVDGANLPFSLFGDILYAKPDVLHENFRPVIPRSMEKDIFQIAHDQLGHVGYLRTHERLNGNVYIFDLGKKLRSYLVHCRECMVNATRRHKPYGSLQPILSPPRLFHSLNIDFILALPKAVPNNFDCVLTVTERLSKAITLIPGKTTWSALQWGNALISHLLMILWGLPHEIISDRDPKFLSQLWRGMFEELKVNLLFSTAWHPQTDGAAERTNQQVEIALRYFIATLSNPALWPTVKDKLSAALSNSVSRATGKTATEVLFGTRIREPLDLLTYQLIKEMPDSQPGGLSSSELPQDPANPPAFPAEPEMSGSYRPELIDAVDAIKFAATYMKQQFDGRHKPMFFKVGDFVLLRLHRGFNVPGIAGNTKLAQQYAGPFKVLEKIGKLAYRLDLPPSLGSIHPVISVAHLEPAPNPADDPYNRSFAQGITLDAIPERIVRRREQNRRNGGKMIQYLIRYRGRPVEYDRWLLDRNVPSQLVEEFERTERVR
ncbi:hypothetical protein K3495_g11949, partial [Podosphaera aphanis]